MARFCKGNRFLIKAEAGKARYSYMGDLSGPSSFEMAYSLETRDVTKIQKGLKSVETINSYFDYLSNLIDEYSVPTELVHWDSELDNRTSDPLGFIGGFVGYFGYEMKTETMPQGNFKVNSASEIPDAAFLFADRVVIFDHWHQRIFLAVFIEDENLLEIQKQWLVDCRLHVMQCKDLTIIQPSPTISKKLGSDEIKQIQLDLLSKMTKTHSRDEYIEMICECLSKIRQGESYELCLTTQLSTKYDGSPIDMYNRLRVRNPAPYGAYLQFNDVTICSSSPERFMQIQDGWMTMKPIKGTLERATPENFSGTDAEIARVNQERITQLQTSEKDFAENLMIVDLTRNDMNLIAVPGSVCVPSLMKVETFATVHQLVSTVKAQLKPELNAIDAIFHTFPPGISP